MSENGILCHINYLKIPAIAGVAGSFERTFWSPQVMRLNLYKASGVIPRNVCVVLIVMINIQVKVFYDNSLIPFKYLIWEINHCDTKRNDGEG